MQLITENPWVEQAGGIIVARIRGMPSDLLLQECQTRVLNLVRSTGCHCVLYDALEMERPSTGIVITQQALTSQLKALSVRIAIVVPNAALAYLSRLAFGAGNHRVFYGDIAGAVQWLTGDSGSPPSDPAPGGSLWVEEVGNFILARIRGMPSEALVHECQSRLLTLLKATDCRRVLYDALEMSRPPVEIAVTQQVLTSELQSYSVRLAVVVPTTALAYLSRLAFGRGEHRVFYADMQAAVEWLSRGPGSPAVN